MPWEDFLRGPRCLLAQMRCHHGGPLLPLEAVSQPDGDPMMRLPMKDPWYLWGGIFARRVHAEIRVAVHLGNTPVCDKPIKFPKTQNCLFFVNTRLNCYKISPHLCLYFFVASPKAFLDNYSRLGWLQIVVIK